MGRKPKGINGVTRGRQNVENEVMFMNEAKMFDTDVADSSDGPRSPILFYLFSSKENGAKEA